MCDFMMKTQPPRRKKASVGRPAKDQVRRRTIEIRFLITPEEAANLIARRPGEKINHYARNRLLGRRVEHSAAKRHLNAASVQLKKRTKTIGLNALQLLAERPDDPRARALADDAAALEAIFGELLDLNRML